VAEPKTISFDEAVLERLQSELDYGDNRSQIVNDALREYFGMEVEA